MPAKASLPQAARELEHFAGNFEECREARLEEKTLPPGNFPFLKHG